ncbi:hypothetical protein KHA93_21520 [Bacillus sp. FJAT-49732]|uniref:Uncharacterized protein n=1 Tax=Lederbergia citrisecunda TaxID=2833583 RepID=A0A942TRV5_9BACI|nr:hypothetical protein [Lederbergia citrisecunda]MBS4202193.1 hypothetical protein [Lederbergia citrisecunda]
MKINIFRVSELLLGLIFLCAGLNGYIVLFGFNPLFPTSPKAMEFLGTGYLLAMEKTPEIVCGILLIIRRLVPLALTILAPIIINILAFHIFVDHALLPLALILFLLEVILIWRYRKSFMGLLSTADE